MLSAQHLLSCIGRHRGQNGCHPNGIDRAWWFIRRIGYADGAAVSSMNLSDFSSRRKQRRPVRYVVSTAASVLTIISR